MDVLRLFIQSPEINTDGSNRIRSNHTLKRIVNKGPS